MFCYCVPNNVHYWTKLSLYKIHFNNRFCCWIFPENLCCACVGNCNKKKINNNIELFSLKKTKSNWKTQYKFLRLIWKMLKINLIDVFFPIEILRIASNYSIHISDRSFDTMLLSDFKLSNFRSFKRYFGFFIFSSFCFIVFKRLK